MLYKKWMGLFESLRREKLKLKKAIGTVKGKCIRLSQSKDTISAYHVLQQWLTQMFDVSSILLLYNSQPYAKL